MIDKTALYTLSLGVYVFATLDGERGVGRIVDAVSQVAADPKQIGVSLHIGDHTDKVVKKGGRFTLTTLDQDTSMDVIQAFGYQSSANVDKFEGFDVAHDEAGVPYVMNGAIAEMSCEITDIYELGSHLLVIGRVVEAQTFNDKEPLTYAGYRAMKAAAKAAAPAEAAPAAGKVGWRCMICGYVVEMDELPDDFKCPMCGVGKELFEKIEL